MRESFAPQSSARWPRRCQDDRVIVGYGLARKRRTGATYFRQFYVMRRDGQGNVVLPSEAVDPLTVEVGLPGVRTARCSELMTPNDKRFVAKIFREKNAPKKKKKILIRKMASLGVIFTSKTVDLNVKSAVFCEAKHCYFPRIILKVAGSVQNKRCFHPHKPAKF